VSDLLLEHGWQLEVAVHGVLTRWAELVGPQVAAHSSPERYADGELVIRAESTAWATQLRLLAPDLVRRLNTDLGDGTVRAVVVRGPDAPRWSHGPRTVPGRGPRDTYG
jgi:predicted nucleic acid-binding Zn ribbon protein